MKERSPIAVPVWAISVKQPAADQIMFAGKDVENRTWRLPPARTMEPVVVHASKRPYPGYGYPSNSDRLGALLGVVWFKHTVTRSESSWFSGPFGWTIHDVAPFVEPIPAKGKLGFWRVPDDIQGRVVITKHWWE